MYEQSKTISPSSSQNNYYQEHYPYGANSGVFNTYSNYFGGQSSPEHYYDWVQGSGLQNFNETGQGLGAVQDFMSQFAPTQATGPANGVQQNNSADPFLSFLMNQLGIAGLGQQQQPPQDRRSAYRQQPPAVPPPDPYQQMISQLSGMDPLLQQLLGAFQAPPPPPPLPYGLDALLGGF